MANGTRLTLNSSGLLEIDENQKPALLIMEDGTTFEGKAFGATTTAVGELVFNTSLMGYQEVLTDPSYAGQVITLTYPEIGNYGTTEDDIESRSIFAKALVIRHLSRKVSNHRATGTLHAFLEKYNIPGISDVDTRAITRRLRDQGAMRCAVSTEADVLSEGGREKLQAALAAAPHMTGQDLTNEVTTKERYTIGTGNIKVAVFDFGIKQNILRELVARGVTATVYPARTKAADILATSPDGIFLSNGPGDPAACADIIAEMKTLIASRIPIFGICLGHQLLSIALGGSTYKLKFGHRGGNHPVKDLTTGKIEVTCQNHGFAVDEKSMPANLELTHINLNDNSVEGFRHKELPIFAVQYHPEAHPGPHDSNYLFDRFLSLIESHLKVTK
ncbi:glutamine-hydrolyzing carbamoyl-phosphate synthase small subunit [soil metagenome]